MPKREADDHSDYGSAFPTTHSLSKKGESTYNRVMRTVAVMYRERGYEGTSMVALAARAGITPPAIYHYFGSKREILAAFLKYTINDLIRTVTPAIRGKTWTAKLTGFVKAVVRWQLQQASYRDEQRDRVFEIRQLRNSLPDEEREAILELERKVYKLCREIIAGGVEDGEFREVPIAATTFAIIGMGEYLVSWCRVGGEMTYVQVADAYADLAVAMVKKSGNVK